MASGLQMLASLSRHLQQHPSPSAFWLWHFSFQCDSPKGFLASRCPSPLCSEKVPLHSLWSSDPPLRRSFHGSQESASFLCQLHDDVLPSDDFFFLVLASGLHLLCCFEKARCIRHVFASTRTEQHKPAVSSLVQRVFGEGSDTVFFFSGTEQVVPQLMFDQATSSVAFMDFQHPVLHRVGFLRFLNFFL